MGADLIEISPVLPSQDIARDVAWYEKYVGFKILHQDNMYAVLRRDDLHIHLQWHADTDDDPLLGGSVIKIFVKDIMPVLQDIVQRGAVHADKLKLNTPWNTHEFGFYDLNRNAIYFVEDI